MINNVNLLRKKGIKLNLPSYIKVIPGNFQSSNCVYIKDDMEYLVDPGDRNLYFDVRKILHANNSSINNIESIIITHSHPDHMNSIPLYSDSKNLLKIFIHEIDSKVFEHGERREWYKKNFKLNSNKINILKILNKDDEIDSGNHQFIILHTPGHTAGSICLYNQKDKILISGDTVMAGDFGQINARKNYFSSLNNLEASLLSLKKLNIEIIIPGHGPIIYGKNEINANFDMLLKKIQKLRKRLSYFVTHSMASFFISNCYKKKHISKNELFDIFKQSEWYNAVNKKMNLNEIWYIMEKCANMFIRTKLIIDRNDGYYYFNEKLIN